MQQFRLQDVQRVGIDITQLDRLGDPRQVGHQMGVIGDGQHDVDVGSQQLTQLGTQRPQLRLHQALIVVLRQPQVGLRVNHLQHAKAGGEERPVATHRFQFTLFSTFDHLLQRGASAQPGR